MTHSLIDPRDTLERQNEKLLKISQTLMRRVEQSTDASGAAYAQFQRAVLLEEEVGARTRDLERALDLLNESNARLAVANRETEAARSDLANAIETIQEGFALFNPDEKLVMCNSRFGMHMPDIRDALKPGLSFTEYVTRVSASQFLSLPDSERPEDWLKRRLTRHKDDHVIFNVRMIWNRWVQVSEHRTGDGGTVILQTDVTDIMRLERQERDRMLDDQARLIRATLEHLDQGVCIFDAGARMVGHNQRLVELLAIPVVRFHMGATFASIFDRFRDKVDFSNGMAPEDIENWVATRDHRAPLSFEIRQGGSRTLAVFAQEMPDKGFVISFTDVSAQRAAVQAIREVNETLEQRVMERTLELEDALEEAERANASKSRFVAAASHDLLQPLSAAMLYVTSLEKDLSTQAGQQVLAKASNALQSAENILEALFDISKLDSGRTAVMVGSVPLGSVLAQLRDEVQPQAHKKGLKLSIVLPEVNVLSDATYLRRILQNLVSNAIRYTEQGRVLVGARRLQNTVRIEVWDTGPGIPEDQQDIIFGEFQRLNATASAAEGMGLGLAIVDRACALLGHPLQVRSIVGKGTLFTVEIPLAPPELALSSPTAGILPTGTAKGLGNLIVMLIENDAELRGALSLTIEGWGADVLACGSEEEARALLNEIGVAPDVIVADYQLDNGRTGAQAIQALHRQVGMLPACIISANRSTELSDECAILGLELMHKPIDADALRGFLQAAQPVH